MDSELKTSQLQQQQNKVCFNLSKINLIKEIESLKLDYLKIEQILQEKQSYSPTFHQCINQSSDLLDIIKTIQTEQDLAQKQVIQFQHQFQSVKKEQENLKQMILSQNQDQLETKINKMNQQILQIQKNINELNEINVENLSQLRNQVEEDSKPQKYEIKRFETELDLNFDKSQNLNKNLKKMEEEMKNYVQKIDVKQIFAQQIRDLRKQILKQPNQNYLMQNKLIENTKQFLISKLEDEQVNKMEMNELKDQYNDLIPRISTLLSIKNFNKLFDQKIQKYQKKLDEASNQSRNSKRTEEIQQLTILEEQAEIINIKQNYFPIKLTEVDQIEPEQQQNQSQIFEQETHIQQQGENIIQIIENEQQDLVNNSIEIEQQSVQTKIKIEGKFQTIQK